MDEYSYRSPVLAAVMLVLAVVTVLTWGSLGSAVTCFLLITMGSALLYQHFLIHRDDDDFTPY